MINNIILSFKTLDIKQGELPAIVEGIYLMNRVGYMSERENVFNAMSLINCGLSNIC